MDSSHLEKMGRELKCPICLSLLNSAVSLSCNHVFCNVCIQKSMKSASDCPVCKVPYRRREVRPAPHMDNLVNIYRSMEVASGVNIFVSQTVPSKKSSGVVNQSEADEVGDKAQMCSKTVDQVNRKKLKGNGLKGHTNRYSGSDAMKPSFPTKKRIQVPHHPVSEAPTQPTRLATVLSEETLYKVQSAVLKEDRPHIENKENKDFCPFFWLQDEEGDADKCTPHTVEDIAMDTPLGTPCFSDLKDSDNELQCKAMSPNIGPSMSHQEDVFDSEMFEWTQRACSPELYSSPKKLQVEQTDRHKEIEEKALAEDIAQRTEGEPYNGKGTNLEKCADIMVEDMTAYGNCTGNNARGTTHEERSKKARQGNQIKQVKPMETCNVLKDITEDTVQKKRVDIVGSPHSSMYVKPKFQKRAKKACASSSAKATVPVNDSTLAKRIKSLDENCSFVVDLSTSLADKGGSNENKQNKQRKRTLESCLDQAELAQHNIQNRNHGKVSNLIKTSNMCKPKRSIKKVCRDGSAANMVTENGCSAMEGVEHMHVADEIMSAVNVYGSPNDNEDICRNQMLNSRLTHIQQGRDHNRRSEPQNLNTASDAIVHQNITDPGSGDGKIGSGSMKDSKSCKKLNYTKNVKFVPADNPNDCQNIHAKINQSSGKISDESPNMNNVLPSKSGILRKCGKRPDTDSIKCFFCHSAEDSEASGVMVHYLNGKPVKVDYTGVGNVIHVHRNCAEWAPNVYFEDEIAINLETELTRSKRIKCGCCGLKGAALGCYEKSCRKSFHVPCAKLTPQCRWDDENFVMLCPLHASSKLPNEISGFQSEQKEKYLSRQLPIHQPNLAARLDDTKSCKWNSHGLSAKLVLCCSGLTIAEKDLVSEFEMQSGVKVLKNWDSCVTHVIASTDENGACRRTLKFLMGILEGKWILNIEWVKACLKANENVNEQQYEIDVDIHGIRDGPRQGRLRLLNKQPKLFGGYKFFFVGDFQPSYKGYLRDLLTAGGGTILHRKPISGDKEAASSTFIIYSLELPDKCNPSKGNLIVNNRRSDAKNLASSCQAVVATNLWILNSIAACKLQILAE